MAKEEQFWEFTNMSYKRDTFNDHLAETMGIRSKICLYNLLINDIPMSWQKMFVKCPITLLIIHDFKKVPPRSFSHKLLIIIIAFL